MLDTISNARAGMQAAAQSFELAASKTVRANANVVDQVTRTSQTAPARKDPLVKSVVQMTKAETNYSANARVMKAADDLMGTTLDMLA